MISQDFEVAGNIFVDRSPSFFGSLYATVFLPLNEFLGVPVGVPLASSSFDKLICRTTGVLGSVFNDAVRFSFFVFRGVKASFPGDDSFLGCLFGWLVYSEN